jgi:exonuclease III
MLKGIFWNCKGLRKKNMAPYVRSLLRESKFDFVCFQETMMQDFLDECIRKVDPNKSFLWDWIPSKGKSGGILSGFLLDRFDVGAKVQGEYILQHNLWDKMLEAKWNLLNLYDYAHDEGKESFLGELASFCYKNKEPFIVGGGFNIMRFISDKNKRSTPSRFSSILNIIINSNDVREIHISGEGGFYLVKQPQ